MHLGARQVRRGRRMPRASVRSWRLAPGSPRSFAFSPVASLPPSGDHRGAAEGDTAEGDAVLTAEPIEFRLLQAVSHPTLDSPQTKSAQAPTAHEAVSRRRQRPTVQSRARPDRTRAPSHDGPTSAVAADGLCRGLRDLAPTGGLTSRGGACSRSKRSVGVQIHNGGARGRDGPQRAWMSRWIGSG